MIGSMAGEVVQIDFSEQDAIAFRRTRHRRTTRIEVRFEADEFKYYTSEFRPIKFWRTSSPPQPLNVIRISDDSSSESVDQDRNGFFVNDKPRSPLGFYSGIMPVEVDQSMHEIEQRRRDKGKDVVEEECFDINAMNPINSWSLSTFKVGESSQKHNDVLAEIFGNDDELQSTDAGTLVIASRDESQQLENRFEEEDPPIDEDSEDELAKNTFEFLTIYKGLVNDGLVWKDFTELILNNGPNTEDQPR
ncbi:uncharacterized protein G2W53_027168 [Senna tora]|uniref:Uncharacterized protein n=1 Tax=Senna tora TaxID=362788 RepID=A0A834TG93_9FABA|nr:uncharacterized protein G2W53_027168 [Senna tora]